MTDEMQLTSFCPIDKNSSALHNVDFQSMDKVCTLPYYASCQYLNNWKSANKNEQFAKNIKFSLWYFLHLWAFIYYFIIVAPGSID